MVVLSVFRDIGMVVVGACLLAVMCSGAFAEKGLVAEYSFATITDNQTPDSSGLDNSAKVYGAIPAGPGSMKGLLFDGVNDYLEIENSASLDLRKSITVECFVHPTLLPSEETGMVGKGISSFALNFHKDGRCWWYINDGGNGVKGAVSTGEWHYVVGTYDGITSRLYIDGKEIGSKVIDTPINQGGKVYVGTRVPGTGHFPGYIAGLKIRDYALGPDEIERRFKDAQVRMLAVVPQIAGGYSVNGKDFLLSVGDAGDIQVNIAGDRYNITSQFSYPGEKIGWNRLDSSNAAGEQGWSPIATKADDGSVTVEAQGHHYAVKRRIELSGHRIVVSDTFENTSGTDMPIIYRSDVVTPQPLTQCRLSGAELKAAGYPENPSAFMAQPQSRLALLAEETVLRLQHVFTTHANGVQMSARRFALQPGKSHTFKWVLYPMAAQSDYWDFVNQVRRDWNVNFTVHGPWVWVDVSRQAEMFSNPAALEKFIKDRNVKIFGLAPWIDYENFSSELGRPITRYELKELFQKAVSAIKAVDPEIICVGCIETGNVSLPEDAKDALYAAIGDKPQNVYALTNEQIDLLKQYDIPWMDSLLMTREGVYRYELYYRGSRYPMIAALVIAQPGNSYSDYIMDQSRFLLEEIGLDGLYYDQFNLVFNDNNRYSYDKWDGTTVDIDPATGNIVRRYTDGALVSIGPRKDVTEYALSKGKYMLANGFPAVQELQGLGDHRFNESEWCFNPLSWADGEIPPFDQRPCEAHFSSPISLGFRPGRHGDEGLANYAKFVMKGAIAYLRHGILYYDYNSYIPETGPGSGEYGALKYMFPITPEELREGWIKGKERIVTAISIETDWHKQGEPRVMIFDLNGREVSDKDRAVIKGESGRWQIKLSLKDWAEIAVID